MINLESDVQKIVDDLDINVDNIVHFIILGGVELIGELLEIEDSNSDEEQNQIILVNPVKILREGWVTEEGYEAQHFFVEWNPCGDGPFATLNTSLIVSKAFPNAATLEAYIRTVNNSYYPEEFMFQMEDDSDGMAFEFQLDETIEENSIPTESSKKTNVIEFIPHLIKKNKDH